MAFGQELKDFVGGFTTGYNLIDSKEEKEEKRAARRRAQESHDRQGAWHDEDTAYREKAFQYGVDRDAVADNKWERQFDFNEEGREYDQTQDGRAQGWREIEREDSLREKSEERRLKREILNDERRRNMGGGAVGDMDRFLGDEALPTDEGAGYQPTSFSPSDAVATAQDAGGFDLASYLPSIRHAESGGRGDAANPNSSARGYYQALGGTWRQVSQKYPELGLTRDGRGNREQEERFIRRFTYDNGKQLQRAGIPVTNGTMYAAHFLGAGGASKVLRAPSDTPLTKLLSGNVISANPFLRGMTVGEFERWSARKGGGVRRKRSINAASGGMIAAIPDDMMDEEDENELAFPMEEQAALPEEGPSPTPRPEYDGAMEGDEEAPTDDPYEQGRRAVRDGLKHAIAQTGADQDSAIDDPELDKTRNQYIRGYGAAPKQMMKQVLDKIDPERQMAPGERNIKAMGTVYRFYMEQGDTEKAKEAAASMVQYYRQATQQFMALGQAAVEAGDIDKAAKAAVAAYTNIPNGRDMTITKGDDGKYTMEVTDAKTGKKVNKQILTPQEMAAAAMQFNPATFDDEILNAAGVAPDEFTDASIEDVSNVAESVRGAIETDLAESGLKPEGMAAVEDFASDVAKIKENGIDPVRAVRLAAGIIDAPEGALKYKPSRGNPGKVDVNFNGDVFTMNEGSFRRMQKLRADNAANKSEMAAKDKADAEANAKTMQGYKDGISKFAEGLIEPDAATAGTRAEKADNIRRARENFGAIPENNAPVEQMGQPPASSEPVEALPVEEAENPNRREIEQLLTLRRQVEMSSFDTAKRNRHIAQIDAELQKLGYRK